MSLEDKKAEVMQMADDLERRVRRVIAVNTVLKSQEANVNPVDVDVVTSPRSDGTTKIAIAVEDGTVQGVFCNNAHLVGIPVSIVNFDTPFVVDNELPITRLEGDNDVTRPAYVSETVVQGRFENESLGPYMKSFLT